MCCRDSQRPVLALLGHLEQLLTTGFPLVMTKSGESVSLGESSWLTADKFYFFHSWGLNPGLGHARQVLATELYPSPRVNLLVRKKASLQL